jgi:hypothetical protein
MKQLLTPFLFVLAFSMQAQTISSIVLVPSSPDANDTLTFYVYCDFPNMSCGGSAMGSVTGTSIYAYGHHCMGGLTALCSDVDTIIIPPQPAGNYSFYFTLDAGFGGPPCSPPFVPNDYDTLDFTISAVTGVHDQKPENSLTVFPNPSNGSLTINIGKQSMNLHQYLVRNELGSLVSMGVLQNNATLTLPNGIYFISIPSLALQQRVVVVK